MRFLPYIYFLFIASIGFGQSTASPLPTDGNTLLAGCEADIRILNGENVDNSTTEKALVTIGYIQGIVDTIVNLHDMNKLATGIPNPIAPSQLVRTEIPNPIAPSQ